ncbi:MAG: hypothetical protein IJI57_04410 [Flexilinea sp.]|nr:hypothetical protein [Flexilinea sp.]
MNANIIYKNFLNELKKASSIEEKEFAMIEAYDELDDCGYSSGEKMAVWNQMMLAA